MKQMKLSATYNQSINKQISQLNNLKDGEIVMVNSKWNQSLIQLT